MEPSEKNQAVHELLRVIAASGVRYVVVDHWEDDLTSIGIAAPEDERRLVYTCTHGRPRGRCYAELEAPVGDSREHTVVARFESISYDELVEVVRGHLQPAQ